MSLTKITGRKIGSIVLDAVTTEDHQSELQITENPIESGALISDHAALKPKRVTINGVMVDHESEINIPFLPREHIRGGVDFLNSLPLPTSVITQTTQTLAKATRLMSQVKHAQEKARDVLGKARKLAPWLPDFGLSGDVSASQSRVQKCYSELVNMQQSAELIEIQTGIHLYKNMLIESVSVTQTQDGSATFTISAREILIVVTQTTASKSSPMGEKKSGRASTQSAKKSTKGNVQPKGQGDAQQGQVKEKKTSWINKTLGG